jgi:hypothetical protein
MSVQTKLLVTRFTESLKAHADAGNADAVMLLTSALQKLARASGLYREVVSKRAQGLGDDAGAYATKAQGYLDGALSCACDADKYS